MSEGVPANDGIVVRRINESELLSAQSVVLLLHTRRENGSCKMNL